MSERITLLFRGVFAFAVLNFVAINIYFFATETIARRAIGVIIGVVGLCYVLGIVVTKIADYYNRIKG